MSIHEEEVLGKAYDARLMRRLLGYLRPQKAYVACALLALVFDALLQLTQPYLVKVAIDRYIAQGDQAGLSRDGSGANDIARDERNIHATVEQCRQRRAGDGTRQGECAARASTS